MTEKAFYSEHDLDAKGVLSRPTRWRMRRSGTFPNPVPISAGRVGYPAKAVHDWIAARSNGEPLVELASAE